MDERNFRSSYYEKVGCYSVEEKKSLNKLLQDNIRNYNKLKQFCLIYTVPQQQRALLWTIILGILPLHSKSTEYVLKQRMIVYEDLLRAVTIMQSADATKPKSHIFLHMWLLENNRLQRSVTMRQEEQNFIEIVNVLLQIFDSDVETYWIAKEFYLCMNNVRGEIPKLKEITESILKREDAALYSHLENLQVFCRNGLLARWYSICFAGIISEGALVRVWDKICGGSRKIVIFIFMELMKTNRDSVMRSKNENDFKALIERFKDQDASYVNRAIKSWQSSKTHTEVMVH